MGALTQVIHLHFVGQALAASGSYRYEMGLRPKRPRCHPGFRRHLIARVNHCIDIDRQQCCPILGSHKLLDAIDLAVRIDGENSLLHGLHLGLANRLGNGVYLAIDIGFRHVVEVYQCQSADAASGQGLNGPRAHASDSDHRYVCVTYLVAAVHTIQTIQRGKSAPTIDRLSQCGQAGQSGI